MLLCGGACLQLPMAEHQHCGSAGMWAEVSGKVWHVRTKVLQQSKM